MGIGSPIRRVGPPEINIYFTYRSFTEGLHLLDKCLAELADFKGYMYNRKAIRWVREGGCERCHIWFETIFKGWSRAHTWAVLPSALTLSSIECITFHEELKGSNYEFKMITKKEYKQATTSKMIM